MNAVFLVNVAVYAHRGGVWSYPYDTGNLVASAGDVGSMHGGIGYVMFDRNQKAPYGVILDEEKTIEIKRKNLRTGRVKVTRYQNRHFGWVEKMTDRAADNIDLAFGTRRGK